MADRVDGQCNHIQLLRLVRYSVEAPIVFGEWKCRECNEVLALALPAEPPHSRREGPPRFETFSDWFAQYTPGVGNNVTNQMREAFEAGATLAYIDEPTNASATPAPSEAQVLKFLSDRGLAVTSIDTLKTLLKPEMVTGSDGKQYPIDSKEIPG